MNIDKNLKQKLQECHNNRTKAGIRIPPVLREQLEKIEIPGFDGYLAKTWAILNNTFEPSRCRTCGTTMPFGGYSFGFRNYCSAKCSAINPNTRQKCKETCVETYGAENPFQSQDIMDKIAQERFERTGAYHQMHVQEIKDRMKNNHFEKYGVEHQMQRQEVKDKVAATNVDKYGTTTGFNGTEGKRVRQSNNWVRRLENLKDIVRLIPNQKQEDFDKKYNWECVTCGHQFVSDLAGGVIPICRKCFPVRTNYSRSAIKWLAFVAQNENIVIQHAENSGEFRIPGTSFSADGYCKETNTVYEFHGDAYHGNPDVYKDDAQCHPFSEKSAIELYAATKLREQKILELGYNLVVMWENDWKKNMDVQS